MTDAWQMSVIQGRIKQGDDWFDGTFEKEIQEMLRTQ